ncbi:hypothetical protein C8Q75DRAFT_723594 [Abortiporus biennis]|nr:hypothetical protein C8Q75DRAFT_723594 [Abortiporus biennis]
MSDPLARLRAFPKAPPPNDNPSAIRGNVSLESKQLCANILAYHVAHYPGSTVFANEALRELKAVEVNVMKTAEGESKKETLKCEAIFETPSLNVHGTLSGGFAAHMLDVCLFGVLFSLGIETGFDASGVSTAMDLNWYSPGLP